MRPLESTTLLGKEYGELSNKHMVCGVTCKRKFDTPRKRFFKKQQGIIDRLYFDIMQTNVRVGDTVQAAARERAHGRRSWCVYIYRKFALRQEHVYTTRPRNCAKAAAPTRRRSMFSRPSSSSSSPTAGRSS
jgi:hypothetical protein